MVLISGNEYKKAAYPVFICVNRFNAGNYPLYDKDGKPENHTAVDYVKYSCNQTIDSGGLSMCRNKDNIQWYTTTLLLNN